jgi:outer membrane lipopolysaccharide assembly protein LptE/RlpB
MKKLISVINILVFLFLTSCGFKVINNNQLKEFSIADITTTGDKKINYNIRNKLLFNSKDNAKKLINIKLNTTKNKSVKERNIKNEITKYEIVINVKVEFNVLMKNNFKNITISKSADYSVAEQYSQTLNNEKNLIEYLSEDIAEEILSELALKLNDI